MKTDGPLVVSAIGDTEGMDNAVLRHKMELGKRLGFNIPSENLVWRSGIICIYKHVMGVSFKEEFASEPKLLAIAEELMALQGMSRLLVGKFFYASINFIDKTQFAELFYDEQFVGEEQKKEIHPKFIALIWRFTEWLNDN